MSRTLYLAADRPVAGVQLNNDRVFLARFMGEKVGMDALCAELGVTSLCDFQSYDPDMLAQYIDDPEMRAAAMAKAGPVQWFEPAAARATVDALLSHGESTGALDARVVWELTELGEVLDHASRSGAKIRLYIDS